MSVNKCILIGNLGNDPDVKNTSTGKTVVNFSLATSESYKDRTTGERKSETTWHNVVIWGQLAEIAAKYLRKGSKVYIEGRIKTRSYDSNGTTKYITEIVADQMTMLGEKPQSAQERVINGPPAASAVGSTDDPPF